MVGRRPDGSAGRDSGRIGGVQEGLEPQEDQPGRGRVPRRQRQTVCASQREEGLAAVGGEEPRPRVLSDRRNGRILQKQHQACAGRGQPARGRWGERHRPGHQWNRRVAHRRCVPGQLLPGRQGHLSANAVLGQPRADLPPLGTEREGIPVLRSQHLRIRLQGGV
uniref:(northern house mosquito) hypothetical protein n=1 Tax=Culex pipiens TaxID=7175 RepID=A0A8D8N0G8_CULPI